MMKWLACVWIGLTILSLCIPAYSAVEVAQQETLKLDVVPQDVALSLDGRWIYVLTDNERMRIYSCTGKLEGDIPVEKGITAIKAGPREDIVCLTSRDNKTVQIVKLDFIHLFDFSESPIKGSSDAPVIVAVFSDFQ